MATDIMGSVEIRESEVAGWVAVEDVGRFLESNDDLFGCLFGVCNHARFRPLFAERGVPADASAELRKTLAEWGDEARSPSWATYAELQSIDGDEDALDLDDRVHEFAIDPEDGSETYVGKARLVGDLLRRCEELERAGEVRLGQRVFRRVRLKRRHALEDPAFGELLERMEDLAAEHGESNVRMVVFFDE